MDSGVRLRGVSLCTNAREFEYIREKKMDGDRKWTEFLSSNCCGRILTHRVTVGGSLMVVAPPSPSMEARGGFDSI